MIAKVIVYQLIRMKNIKENVPSKKSCLDKCWSCLQAGSLTALQHLNLVTDYGF